MASEAKESEFHSQQKQEAFPEIALTHSGAHPKPCSVNGAGGNFSSDGAWIWSVTSIQVKTAFY
jgi:hypothetical protein